MTLPTIRAIAYLSGAFAGALTAVALIASQRGGWKSGVRLIIASLVAGAVAVGAEERAVQREADIDSPEDGQQP